MRIAFLVLMFLAGTQALAYPCPADLEAVKAKRLLHNWVSQFKGQHVIAGCKVEFTACNPLEPRGDGQMLAELYIVDYRRREAYLPLIIVPSGNPKVRTSLEAYPKSLFYIKWDYFYEKEFGETETYRLDIRLTEKGNAIESIDLGTYSTNKALDLPGGTQSRWYNCGKTFEED